MKERKKIAPKEWKVRMVRPFEFEGNEEETLCFISSAALFVKVIARIDDGEIPWFSIR